MRYWLLVILLYALFFLIVRHETATKHSALVRINSVSHTADIHLPDTEIALRNPIQGHEQGGGSFYGLRIR